MTGNPGVVPPTGAHTLLTLALAGQEAQARETAAAVAREAPQRGAVGEMAFATSSLAILELGLGNYEAAVAACCRPGPTTPRSWAPAHSPT